jgi:hypothetical protein
MCAPQITVAAVTDRRSEPTPPTAYLPAPLHPVAYWLVNALASLVHRTDGLIRGPRGKRVTWDLAHDGAPGGADRPAPAHAPERSSGRTPMTFRGAGGRTREGLRPTRDDTGEIR